MKSKKIKGTTHYVFSDKREFEEFFLLQQGSVPHLVDDWRTAKQGDWVIADDGGVVQILKAAKLPHPKDRKNYKQKRNGYCRTVVGAFIQGEKYFMDTDFDLHPDRYRFGSSTDGEYLRRRKTRKELSNPEVVFVSMICAGRTLQEAYEESFGPTHDWYRRALFLLKRDRIMTKIKEDVKDKLSAKFDGDVVNFIFDQLKEIILNTDNDNTKLSAIKELAEWSGEKEQNKTIAKGEVHVFQPFSGSELKKIEAEEVKVLAESTVED